MLLEGTSLSETIVVKMSIVVETMNVLKNVSNLNLMIKCQFEIYVNKPLGLFIHILISCSMLVTI